MNTTSELADMVEMVEDQPQPTYIDDKRPQEHDPEWSEYLLDQLSDSELINGAPTVDGLRRIILWRWRFDNIAFGLYNFSKAFFSNAA